MMDNIGNNYGTKVVEANCTIGGDTRSPVRSSLQRHVYHTNGADDFLNKERAIQVSIILYVI